MASRKDKLKDEFIGLTPEGKSCFGRDAEEYIEAWERIAKPVAKYLGGEILGYDPDVLIGLRSEDNERWKFTLTIPCGWAQELAKKAGKAGRKRKKIARPFGVKEIDKLVEGNCELFGMKPLPRGTRHFRKICRVIAACTPGSSFKQVTRILTTRKINPWMIRFTRYNGVPGTNPLRMNIGAFGDAITKMLAGAGLSFDSLRVVHDDNRDCLVAHVGRIDYRVCPKCEMPVLGLCRGALGKDWAFKK